jgi:hypothetical protein
MNKSYKSVWNETTGTYVAASEVAKSIGKRSRNKKALVAALMAVGVGFGTAVKAEAADNLSEANTSTCATLPDGTPDPSNSADCAQTSQSTTESSSSANLTGQQALLGASMLGSVAPVTTPTSYFAMGGLDSTTRNAKTGTFQTDLPNAAGQGSIAIGGGSVATGLLSIATGMQANATGYYATVYGAQAQATGYMSTALGGLAGYGGSGDYSVAAGTWSAGTATDATALGAYATASANNSVAIGYQSTASAANTVSVGSSSLQRQIVNVAAGAVTASSTDAVNGSELYGLAASEAAALGGGSSVTASGAISAPSYVVGGMTVNDVGAAVANLDGRVTANSSDIAQNTNDIGTLNTQVGTINAAMADVVKYDTSAHDTVTLGGSSGTTLTNVAAGGVSASSTDAVTGAQLWNTNQQLSDLTQSVQNQQQTGSSAMSINTGSQPAAAATGNNAVAVGGGSQASGDNSVAIGSGSVADEANTVSVGSQGNERRITNVANGTAATDAVNLGQMQSAIGDTARAAYSGVAAATALTMIPEVDPGKTLAVGVAGGTYKGYQAAAVGASARITQNLKVKVGAGISGSETTVGAGASYQW